MRDLAISLFVYVWVPLSTLALLPLAILVWLWYLLPFWAFGHLRWNGWVMPGVASFAMVAKPGSLARKLWIGWRGWSGPGVIVIRDGLDTDAYMRTVRHELEHIWQQLWWGPLFYPAYGLASVWIWCFMPSKHSYYDNPFERAARRVAGQPVDIPKELWRGDDRWIWW